MVVTGVFSGPFHRRQLSQWALLGWQPAWPSHWESVENRLWFFGGNFWQFLIVLKILAPSLALPLRKCWKSSVIFLGKFWQFLIILNILATSMALSLRKCWKSSDAKESTNKFNNQTTHLARSARSASNKQKQKTTKQYIEENATTKQLTWQGQPLSASRSPGLKWAGTRYRCTAVGACLYIIVYLCVFL